MNVCCVAIVRTAGETEGREIADSISYRAGIVASCCSPTLRYKSHGDDARKTRNLHALADRGESRWHRCSVHIPPSRIKHLTADLQG